MDYVYPKLSAIDLNITRIGGLGLGNMLFPYARAVLYAGEHHLPLIWPTWNSVPAGQILRREKNKRFYHDLFTPVHMSGPGADRETGGLCVISGWEKICLRMAGRTVSEEEARKRDRQDPDFYNRDMQTQRQTGKRPEIIEFSGMEGEFTPLLGRDKGQYLYEHLKNILQDRNKKALEFHPGRAVCMHVRLGDFTRAGGSTAGGTATDGSMADENENQAWEEALRSGQPNLSIPVEWYAGLVRQIRSKLGYEIPVYLFSDGTEEELKPLLQLPGVERKTFGTAIADIMAMAQAELFIASGSTFSRWVRYLGRMNTIAYPGQLGQKLLDAGDHAFETEAVQLPDEILGEIYAQMAE